MVEEFRHSFSDIPFPDADWARNIRAFFEVHIEQGPVLESKGCRLGVVSAVAGTSTIEVSVEGRADHAGSTPMNLRSDAFEVAAHAAVEMYRYARSLPHTVATVGRLRSPMDHQIRSLTVPGSPWISDPRTGRPWTSLSPMQKRS